MVRYSTITRIATETQHRCTATVEWTGPVGRTIVRIADLGFASLNISSGIHASVSPPTSIHVKGGLFYNASTDKERVLTSDTNEKPYVCDCGQSFTRRDLLRRHQRLVHPLPSPLPATNSSKPDVNSQGMHGVRETTLASSTAPETSTPATAISASQSQVAVDDTLAIAQGDVAVKPGPVLPLPPEYPDMLPSNLEPDTEDEPLSIFQKFIVHSGLVSLLGGPRSSGFNQHQTPGITHGSSHSTCETQSGTQSNSTLPPDLQDVDIHSDTNMDYQENIDPSDSTFQVYLIQNPNFVPPSAQTTVRYLKSFMRNSRFEVFHPRADINCLPVVARLAILAIGAWHLFEAHSAMLLFRASRDIALELWTSPQHDSTLFEQQ
ncbi:hypothetical protein FOBRF1_006996 [Fusarium oxysporum]